MKWFKLDSGFLNDNRIKELILLEGHIGLTAYIYILTLCAEQWNGEENKIFNLCLPAMKRTLNCKQTKFKSIINSIQTVFNMSLISVQNEFNMSFEYPKFLKKQKSYFSGAATRSKSNRIEENRIDKNIIYTSQQVCDDAKNITLKLINLMKENNVNCKIPNNLDSWHKEADRLINIDKRPLDEILKVMTWCQQNDFWKCNILSMPKFRKKYDQLKLNSEVKNERNFKTKNNRVSNSEPSLDYSAEINF